MRSIASCAAATSLKSRSGPYLGRYTCRGSKSTRSQINVDNVARLIAEGRMTEHGLAQLKPAKADGVRPAPIQRR
ncbi:MAG: hypothetical protein E5X88_19515 [Mesorhizobium sp.]|nr:MAG: hypothetical protein E5X88_19515 [Mesorhizobium sp.]